MTERGSAAAHYPDRLVQIRWIHSGVSFLHPLPELIRRVDGDIGDFHIARSRADKHDGFSDVGGIQDPAIPVFPVVQFGHNRSRHDNRHSGPFVGYLLPEESSEPVDAKFRRCVRAPTLQRIASAHQGNSDDVAAPRFEHPGNTT